MKRPCLVPGCRKYAVGRGRCEEHAPRRPPGGRRSRATDRLATSSAQWLRIRKLFLAEHPLCQDHLERGQVVPATDVHHMPGTDAVGGEDFEGLLALCHACHSRRTARGE